MVDIGLHISWHLIGMYMYYLTTMKFYFYIKPVIDVHLCWHNCETNDIEFIIHSPCCYYAYNINHTLSGCSEQNWWN